MVTRIKTKARYNTDMTKKLKIAWGIFGIPAGLVGLYVLNNLYTFYKYWQVKDTLVCDDIFNKVQWTANDFLCFSPHFMQGTLWLLACVVFVFAVLIAVTRRAKR